MNGTSTQHAAVASEPMTINPRKATRLLPAVASNTSYAWPPQYVANDVLRFVSDMSNAKIVPALPGGHAPAIEAISNTGCNRSEGADRNEIPIELLAELQLLRVVVVEHRPGERIEVP